MFESNRAEDNAAKRKTSPGLLISTGLHAVALGALVLSHDPVAVVLEPAAISHPIALVAPPPEKPRAPVRVRRPRTDTPAVTATSGPARWNPVPPMMEPAEVELAAPASAISGAPPAVPETIPLPTVSLPPEPAVRTGEFGEAMNDMAGMPAPRQATPTELFTTPRAAASLGPAKLSTEIGAFGEPTGAPTDSKGRAGGAVRIGEAFGTGESPSVEARRTTEVRSTSFGTPSAAPSAPRHRPPAAPAHFDRGIEIVSKPRPRYTDEARRLRVEGEVVLEVLFSANGEVHVKRLVRGLGHGLDERAVEAAMLINFLPARREGKPVDIVATVRIQFQLA